MRMHNPPHPGLVLAENFDDKFTVEEAALKMGVSVKTLTDILECKAPITKEIALLLAGIFPGEPLEQWLGLQNKYDAWQAAHDRQWQKQVIAEHKLSPNFLDGLFGSVPA